MSSHESTYFLYYAALCMVLGLTYIKVQSAEGTTITTNEFQLFQKGFLSAHAAIFLAELLSLARYVLLQLQLQLQLQPTTTATTTTTSNLSPPHVHYLPPIHYMTINTQTTTPPYYHYRSFYPTFLALGCDLQGITKLYVAYVASNTACSFLLGM